MSNRSSLILSLCLALGVHAGSAAAQDFPSKPGRLIVPTAAGGIVDITARVVGTEMAKILGQPFIVENKPSSGHLLGYEYVAKQAPADGYTIGLAVVDSLATLPITVKDLRFDPLKDLPPLIDLIELINVLGSNSSKPWTKFNEMVAYAKANPGKLNYGSSGTDILLNTAGLVQALGINMVHIPYKQGTAFNQALVTGEIDIGLTAELNATRFRVLAVSGERRRPKFPDAPTFSELGFPQIKSIVLSMNLALGTPKPVVEKLHAAASRALEASEVKVSFAKYSAEIIGDTPEVAAKRLADSAQFFADVAKKAGIRPPE